MKIKSLMALVPFFILPNLSFAFMCPTNFNQINFGMTPDQVIQICGKPDDQKESVKQSDNIPQEWIYFIPQTVSMGGNTGTAQGTLRTSISFDEKGNAINISVNGIGVGASTICGNSNIQLGASKDQIKSACGKPSFINKQSGGDVPPPSKILELTYSSASPKVTLVFENGVLTDKK
jgi:hypothetical protein